MSLEKNFEAAAYRVHDTQWTVFLFQIPFNGTLQDFKRIQLVIIFVSFCDLGVELYTQGLVKFLLAAPFSSWRDWHRPASEVLSFRLGLH